MIKEIKNFWAYILAFIVINLIILNVASIISEPYEVGDLLAPMVLVFQIILTLSSFFTALIITFILFSKTSDFKEQLQIIIVSVVLFSLIGIALNFFTLFTFTQGDWEQGYLDAVLALPFEFSLEQFQTLTYFDAAKQVFVVLVQNTGAAFFGFLLGRKLRAKSR